MSANLIPILWESTLQTLYMVAMATVLGTLIGNLLGQVFYLRKAAIPHP